MGWFARTVAMRRCGHCQRPLGIALWSWSGRVFVTTHGLCDRCFRQLLSASAPASTATPSLHAPPRGAI
jgi:hypothetical protein